MIYFAWCLAYRCCRADGVLPQHPRTRHFDDTQRLNPALKKKRYGCGGVWLWGTLREPIPHYQFDVSGDTSNFIFHNTKKNRAAMTCSRRRDVFDVCASLCIHGSSLGRSRANTAWYGARGKHTHTYACVCARAGARFMQRNRIIPSTPSVSGTAGAKVIIHRDFFPPIASRHRRRSGWIRRAPACGRVGCVGKVHNTRLWVCMSVVRPVRVQIPSESHPCAFVPFHPLPSFPL